MFENTVRLGEGGRVVIPAGYRKALGLEPGDEVVMALEDGEVRLMTPKRAVERAQALVRRYIPQDRSLSEDLLRDRREETARG